jgi:hypothetical protein
MLTSVLMTIFPPVAKHAKRESGRRKSYGSTLTLSIDCEATIAPDATSGRRCRDESRWQSGRRSACDARFADEPGCPPRARAGGEEGSEAPADAGTARAIEAASGGAAAHVDGAAAPPPCAALVRAGLARAGAVVLESGHREARDARQVLFPVLFSEAAGGGRIAPERTRASENRQRRKDWRFFL